MRYLPYQLVSRISSINSMSVLGCWIPWQAYPWREASHPLLRRRTLRADGATVFGCHFGGHVLALLSHHIVHGEVQFFRCLLMGISASQSSFWDGQQWSMISLCGRLTINWLAGLWILPINSLIWWDGFESNFFSCCKSFWLAGKHPTESIETFCPPQPLSFFSKIDPEIQKKWAAFRVEKCSQTLNLNLSLKKKQLRGCGAGRLLPGDDCSRLHHFPWHLGWIQQLKLETQSRKHSDIVD